MAQLELNWYTPFLISAELESRLAGLGLNRFGGTLNELPAGSLLIYVQPHALLERSPSEGFDALMLQALIEDYAAVSSVHAHHRLIVDWRLEALEQTQLASWLAGEGSCPAAAATAPTPSDPLLVLILQDLFSKDPELLDHYLDLELQAELAQTAADTDYLNRLLQGLDASQLLEYWRLRKQQQDRLSALEAELLQTTSALAATKADHDQSVEQLQKIKKLQAVPHPPLDPAAELSPCDPSELDHQAWQAVIEGHPLESHDPAEWLRYGVALFHCLEPGPQQGQHQQQAALAFIHARQVGATEESVEAVLQAMVRAQFEHAIQLVVHSPI